MNRDYDEPLRRNGNGPAVPRNNELDIPPPPQVRNSNRPEWSRDADQPIQRVARWDERSQRHAESLPPAGRASTRDAWTEAPTSARPSRDPGRYDRWSE